MHNFNQQSDIVFIARKEIVHILKLDNKNNNNIFNVISYLK